MLALKQTATVSFKNPLDAIVMYFAEFGETLLGKNCKGPILPI